MVATRKNGKPKSGHKNPILIPGIHRFGRSTMYHKKGIWAKRAIVNPKKVAVKKPTIVEKKVGGEKNGGTRKVNLVKSKRYYPTATGFKRQKVTRNNVVSKKKLRGSLVPGTICILVAGRHAGRRVVLLKQLKSGLLLVTGPFKINSVPLRRVNQRYVIATSTKIDISKVKVPEKYDDTYFRRDKKETKKLRKAQQGDIFAAEKSGYSLKEHRKTDQVEMDKQLIVALKANPEKKLLFKYLSSPFYLRTGQFPHRMKF
ncbi:60S ribosomal protein L6 [Folsomia candida]|uniref:60S ribosomal protein L6 n=1 Tax=Folsomia candida TaxID=158441 RepID=UPI000B908850|nr:60S ribosomal protein L6 [Folsomia candida]